MRAWRGGATMAAFSGLVAIGLLGCGGEAATAHRVTPPAVAVTATAAWSADAGRTFPARIEAGREAAVSTRTSGVLRAMPVDVGDRVRSGQVVAVLAGEDVSARIRAAEAQLSLAEQTHGRLSRLAGEGAASQQELDQATAALEAAEASVEEAEAQAGYVQVTAPFTGVVSQRDADPGDLAVPGRPLLRIQQEGRPRVVADLPSDVQTEVEVGTEATVRSGGRSGSVTITRVVPSLDAQSRRFRVEARLEGASEWRPGTVVSLLLQGSGAGSSWIPSDAVIRRGQLTGVFNVEADTLRLRWLRMGREAEGAVEVLAAPALPLVVVRRPGAELVDGTPVSGVTLEDRP